MSYSAARERFKPHRSIKWIARPCVWRSRTFARPSRTRYPKAEEYLRRLDSWEARLPDLRKRLEQGDVKAKKDAAEIVALQREALLANPLLDFDRLLLVKRKPVGDPRRPKGNGFGLGEFLGLPRQSSWQQDTIPNRDGWENEIAVLTDLRHGGKLSTLFQPPVDQAGRRSRTALRRHAAALLHAR